VTRPHHALEGKVLEVFAKLRHRGKPHFVLVLPDGSRSYMPVAWTDVASNPESSAPPCSSVGSASDLLRLRQRVDCLLRRIESGPATSQNLPILESEHAKAATRTVERGTSSDSTPLPTALAPTAEQSCPLPGPTHGEVGARSSHKPSALGRKQTP
jgi:hypothetical protein